MCFDFFSLFSNHTKRMNNTAPLDLPPVEAAPMFSSIYREDFNGSAPMLAQLCRDKTFNPIHSLSNRDVSLYNSQSTFISSEKFIEELKDSTYSRDYKPYGVEEMKEAKSRTLSSYFKSTIKY